jgi:hypothetical protein
VGIIHVVRLVGIRVRVVVTVVAQGHVIQFQLREIVLLVVLLLVVGAVLLLAV